MIGYSIFIVAFAISVACISYSIMARQNGWPVGEALVNDASVPKIGALVTAFWALGKSFFVFSWWSPLVVLIFGWLLAFVVTMLLKKNIQILCTLGIFPMLTLTILYISENRPLGFLHRFFS